MSRPTPRCPVCGPQAKGVFCALAGTHLVHLDQEKTVQHFNRGQVIFYEGHTPFGVHCVFSGRVKLYKLGRKAEPHVIRMVGQGDVMGFRALIAGEPYAATAEALEDSTICFITRDTIVDLIRRVPELGLALMAKLAQELRLSEEQLIEVSQEPVAQRVARLLLWLADSGHEETAGAQKITVPLRRNDMAQMVGTTAETFSRVLHDFARRGLIQVDRSTITLTDRPGLEKLSRR